MAVSLKSTGFLWLSVMALIMSQQEVEEETSTLANVKQHQYDNGFEEETVSPWIDLSEGETEWVITESAHSNSGISECNALQLPLPPSTGKYFLVLKQDLKTFDMGTLSTDKFLALQGVKIQFSYCWISSTWYQFNNLQVFWSESGQEDKRLIELYPTSNADNNEWRNSTVVIPVSRPTEGKIVIYAFGSPVNDSGLIAIDDIKFIQEPPAPISTIKDVSSITTSYSTDSLFVTEDIITENSKSSSQDGTTLETVSSTLITNIFGTTAKITNTCFNSSEIPDGTDFSPCTCHWFDDHVDEPWVTCDQVNMTDVRDGLFPKLDHIYMDFLELKIMDGDSIPSHFLGSAVRRINYLFINCMFMDNPLTVDEKAFQNLDNSTTEFNYLEMRNCDISSLDFFSEMKRIGSVTFQNSSNIHEYFSTIPFEFETEILNITQCRNLNFIDDVSKLPAGLSGLLQFRAFGNEDLNDAVVDLLLEWMLSSTTKNSLKNLYIYDNALTKIPTQLWLFRKLQFFRFERNVLSTGIVEKGNFKFSFVAFIVFAMGCGINKIEPGAFDGDFSVTGIDLSDNNLTRFESDVFKPVLDQMAPYKTGEILVGGNPFDCISDPCHLAWLLRDGPNLLYYVTSAFCEDGRSFELIQPDDTMFEGCP